MDRSNDQRASLSGGEGRTVQFARIVTLVVVRGTGVGIGSHAQANKNSGGASYCVESPPASLTKLILLAAALLLFLLIPEGVGMAALLLVLPSSPKVIGLTGLLSFLLLLAVDHHVAALLRLPSSLRSAKAGALKVTATATAMTAINMLFIIRTPL